MWLLIYWYLVSFSCVKIILLAEPKAWLARPFWFWCLMQVDDATFARQSYSPMPICQACITRSLIEFRVMTKQGEDWAAHSLSFTFWYIVFVHTVTNLWQNTQGSVDVAIVEDWVSDTPLNNNECWKCWKVRHTRAHFGVFENKHYISRCYSSTVTANYGLGRCGRSHRSYVRTVRVFCMRACATMQIFS